MFKNIIIAVALFITTFAAAQTTKITFESNTKGAQNVSAMYCEDDNFIFAQYCDSGYWQAYAGKTYAPTSHTQVALGAGVEDGGLRLAGWFWGCVDNFSILHAFEDGATHEWHRTIVKYQATDKVSLGVTDRSFYGKGVRAEVKLGSKTTAIMEHFEGGKSTLAVSTVF